MAFPTKYRESKDKAYCIRLAASGSQRKPPLRTLSIAFLAMMASAGCASAASDAFPFATATRGCTQEDAPALEIYLTHAAYDGAQEPSPPYLRIEIASTPAEPLRRAPMTLVPLRREAFSAPIVRAEYVGLKREHAWLAGTVTLTDGAQGGPLAGRYDFAAPNGKRFKSTIHAAWNARPAVCG